MPRLMQSQLLIHLYYICTSRDSDTTRGVRCTAVGREVEEYRQARRGVQTSTGAWGPATSTEHSLHVHDPHRHFVDAPSIGAGQHQVLPEEAIEQLERRSL